MVSPNVCLAPYQPTQPIITPSILVDGQPLMGVANTTKIWDIGSTLKVGFHSGSRSQQSFFRDGLNEWFQHINLKFEIVADWRTANIRASHIQGTGNWSLIGKDSDRNRQSPSLNIAEDRFDNILHEIGHALGLQHEQQNKAFSIPLNRDRIIAELSGPPNRWNLQTIQKNVFDQLSGANIINTDFDRFSIMQYPISANWTLDGSSIPLNTQLSRKDIAFIKQMYPYNTDQIIKEPGTTFSSTGILIGGLVLGAIVLGSRRRAA